MEKSYNQPDLNAPRHRTDRRGNLNREFYARFRKKYPKYKHISDVQIKEIIITFNKKVSSDVVGNRDGVELPEGLGYLFVGSCPAMVKKNNLNKILSEEHKQQIKHRNFESDSMIAKIFYTNYANRYKFKMRELWMFKGCREFTRAVSKSYVENWKSYIQVDSFMHIRKLYKKLNNRQLAIRFAVKPTAEYNEFDLD